MKKKRVTVHIIKTRKGKPSKIDPSDCEIWNEMVTNDIREEGITMDLKRAEELCRKIMEKDK